MVSQKLKLKQNHTEEKGHKNVGLSGINQEQDFNLVKNKYKEKIVFNALLKRVDKMIIDNKQFIEAYHNHNHNHAHDHKKDLLE